jgi:hypothetical protein
MAMVLMRGNIRPVRLYDAQEEPYWDLSFEGFMALPDREEKLVSILSGVSSRGRMLLARLDKGMTEKSVQPFAGYFSYFGEDRETRRPFLGFEAVSNCAEFFCRSDVSFLHDITIILAEDFVADRQKYFSSLLKGREFPSQEVFESYGLSIGLALPKDGFISLVSDDHDLCFSVSERLSYSPDSHCHSSLPDW